MVAALCMERRARWRRHGKGACGLSSSRRTTDVERAANQCAAEAVFQRRGVGHALDADLVPNI